MRATFRLCRYFCLRPLTSFSRFLAAVASARDFSYVSGHLATHQRRAPTPAASLRRIRDRCLEQEGSRNPARLRAPGLPGGIVRADGGSRRVPGSLGMPARRAPARFVPSGAPSPRTRVGALGRRACTFLRAACCGMRGAGAADVRTRRPPAPLPAVMQRFPRSAPPPNPLPGR